MAGEDFGGWISIVVIIIAAIISLVKNATKKISESENIPQIDEEDLIREFERQNNIVPEKRNKKKEYRFEAEQEGGRISRKVDKVYTELEEDVEYEEIDFDLKKAVIYNEILNRKYDW